MKWGRERGKYCRRITMGTMAELKTAMDPIGKEEGSS
jgi:hypothetical protein